MGEWAWLRGWWRWQARLKSGFVFGCGFGASVEMTMVTMNVRTILMGDDDLLGGASLVTNTPDGKQAITMYCQMMHFCGCFVAYFMSTIPLSCFWMFIYSLFC